MRYLWVVIFCSLFGFASIAQQTATIKQLEAQRKKALAEIETTNKLLKETTQSARNSLNRLNLLSSQILSRKKVITLLNQEVTAIDKQLVDIQNEIIELEKELEAKRTSYGKSAQSLHSRYRSQDKLLYILSADNFQQSIRRMRYLRKYAYWQKQKGLEIIEKQKEIERRQEELRQTKEEKQALLAERESENNKLIAEESNRKKEVNQLNKKQKELQAELKKKQQQANALNKQIEKLIAEEVAKANAKSKEAGGSDRKADTKGGYAMTKAEKQLSENFANNKGKLPMPLQGSYSIVGTFGEQQHQELKYVRTNNSGIDIQTTPGNEARAVFNGEVTRVFVVPGYNNSVIVRHGNYLTVYSNLSQVYVKAGEKVNTRQALGKIFSDSENGNATILHFQLWRERTKQNPLPWLDR